METRTRTDKGLGLGVLFSIVAVGGALATAALGYTYAVNHAAGEAARATQVNAGIAFGVGLLAAGLAVTALHVYDN